ncbi:FAD/NAD(P)-binding protein [Nitratireductor sp. GCM10026969]|uniref:FAD/NAD(P)-binding protein n=1 Tax=Nitratireductor sp. GCM10026969 TaxID=3252645 RepID=UPI0036184784
MIGTLAIVGAGATGVGAFMAAVQQRIAERIYIIDPQSVGGTVFRTTDDEIICNTAVDVTSIDPENEYDFLDYLRCTGHAASESAYMPRRVFGDYVKSRYYSAVEKAKQAGIDVKYINGKCEKIEFISKRNYNLILSDWSERQELRVTDVLLCTGHGPSKIPRIFEPHSRHPTFFRSPYPETEMLAKMPTASDVLIVGSKLTAVDAALLLCREGHRVTMMSPSGELPSVRSGVPSGSKFPLSESTLKELMSLWNEEDKLLNYETIKFRYLLYISRILKTIDKTPLRKQISFKNEISEKLKEEIIIAENGSSIWQNFLFSFLNAANSIRMNSQDFKIDIEPNTNHELARYITSTVLPNAKKIFGFIEKKTLSVEKGHVSDVRLSHKRDKAWNVIWEGGEGRFDAVVCASGFHNHRYYFDDTGALVLTGECPSSQASTVDIASDLSIRHPKTKEEENIWITGSATNGRVYVSGAVALAIPQVCMAVNALSNRLNLRDLEICI